MTDIKRSPWDFSKQELDMELIARGSRIHAEIRLKFPDIEGTPAREEMIQCSENFYLCDSPFPLNPAMSHLDLNEISDTLIQKVREFENKKAQRGTGIRMEVYQVACPHIQRNAKAVVSIWMKDSIEANGDISFLQHKQFGKSFHLCPGEPYYFQPVARGRLCTGFLVGKDVIATAAHCVDQTNLKNLRFVFGYRINEDGFPCTELSADDIYSGTGIIQRVYDPMGSGVDWALVKIDREVGNRRPLTLATGDINPDTPVYVLGHPRGLPLKYVADEPVKDVEPAYFSADLSVYGGNSGSPVFDAKTHEVVGIVVRGDQQDFRWTEDGWISVQYPDPVLESPRPQCTKVSLFRNLCQ